MLFHIHWLALIMVSCAVTFEELDDRADGCSSQAAAPEGIQPLRESSDLQANVAEIGTFP